MAEQRLSFEHLTIYTGEDRGSFTWDCPKCGRAMYGYLADEPVSGWDEPRWKMTGPPEAPTLEPSLGCSGYRDGSCPGGHYFFRDGKLVDA